jgi:methylase of polypeptide subunit release factors
LITGREERILAESIIPILDRDAVGSARSALAEFTPDAVRQLLGPVGRAAQARGDLAGVARALPVGERLSTLVRLLLLGHRVPEPEARSALAPLNPERLPVLFECSGDQVRARYEVRPYAEAAGDPWWVLSDFGSDVRPGPLAPDHVLGIGAASLTLAQAVIRRPVGRALDVGVGSGVQSLHLARHAGSVTGTDISRRALRLAATTAALSGHHFDLREGSLLEPVRDQKFDLVVANPPFVVSPGRTAQSPVYDYRDSGLAGDAASRVLVTGIPGLLAPDGTASVLANWIIPADGDWQARVSSWVTGRGCDAWIWQREVAEPGEYAAMWLRDAGETPGSPRWTERYNAWLDWFAAHGIVAVGMGLVTLWRTAAEPIIVCDDVPQPVEQPVGAYLPAWIRRRRWLASCQDAQLLATHLRCAPGVVRVRQDLHSVDGWQTSLSQLRHSHGMRWELEADDPVAALVGACDGSRPLGLLVDVLALSLGAPGQDVAQALLPVVRDLVGRGFLDRAAEADGAPDAEGAADADGEPPAGARTERVGGRP